MKPRGRRPLAEDDPSVTVSLRLPGKAFDRVQQEADRQRLALGAWLRRVVEQACKDKSKV